MMQHKTNEQESRRKGCPRLLNNGNETYAALIGELQRARRSIHLEYYIFNDDRIGQAISSLLIRRAKAGVKVRIIYDLFGSWLPARGMLRRLRENGVEVRYFRPLHLCRLGEWLNIRNHRKIAIIDGRIAFLGGINIARRYLEGSSLGRWRDLHLQLEGRVVGDLERLFREDWLLVGGEPYPTSAGSAMAAPIPHRLEPLRIIASREGSSRKEIETALIDLINGAGHELLASTPYLIPPHSLREALKAAVRRGVRVQLMIPSRVEWRVVGWAAESYFEELLAAGIELYRYENGFLHTKMVLCDRRRCYIGTANLDYRSLRINWEVGALIQDRGFGERVARTFIKDKKHCHRLRSSEQQKRASRRRLLYRIGRLFAPLF